MQPFTFERVSAVDQAVGAIAANPQAMFIAGGTEMVNWLKEGIARPRHLIDINAIPIDWINAGADGLRIGALARMSDVAAHPAVRSGYPAIAESLELSASPQLRNMATIGGNLMQRTRCPYFRAEVELPCNKRTAGSGCSALHGENRSHAIFGWTEHCVATHPSDLAVVLAALDATVTVQGKAGARTIPLTDFHRLPDHGVVETVLDAGELITEIQVPASPLAAQSRYLKVRERASYEFALVSAAAAVVIENGTIRTARVALGGVAHKPWRLWRAEQAMAGRRLERSALIDALEADFRDAKPLEHNGFKVALARRAAARALEMAGGLA